MSNCKRYKTANGTIVEIRPGKRAFESWMVWEEYDTWNEQTLSEPALRKLLQHSTRLF